MKKAEVHRDLCDLLLQVERDGDIQPVIRFIDSLSASPKVELDIVNWIQRFTPFVFRQREDGKQGARKDKRDKRKTFNLDGARNTPIWPRKQAKAPAASDSTQLSTVSKLNRNSEERLQVQSQRAILKAVREFLASPGDREYGALIEQIEEYRKYQVTVAGIDREIRSRSPYVSVVQGGLPSLGKGAK
jgi:hypothetical protein